MYHLLFSGREGETWFTFLSYRVTYEGLRMALFYSLRLIIFISIAFLITLTNSPSELADAITKLLKPLAKFRVPIYDLSLILFIAIRFIPILYEEFTAIKNAQLIRGVDFSGKLMTRLKKTTSIIIPVFVAAIQRADDLALAIQARGYRGGASRTFYSCSKFGNNELIFSLVTSSLILIIFYFTR